MTLLEQIHREKMERRESLRLETRARLRQALQGLVPAVQVLVFGSLTKPHRFTENSDIDIALHTEPASMSLFQLTALLSESMGRPVDIVLLSECRFSERITKEGELWTLAA